MNIKQIAAIVALVFAIVLAVVVAKQMSTEAMAVVIGIVCGVAAGIPTSILLLVTMTRRDQRRMEEKYKQTPYGQQGYPPVVVVQGNTPHALPQGLGAQYWPAPQPGPAAQRDFTVVGGEDLVIDDSGPWSDIGNWRI